MDQNSRAYKPPSGSTPLQREIALTSILESQSNVEISDARGQKRNVKKLEKQKKNENRIEHTKRLQVEDFKGLMLKHYLMHHRDI